MSESCPEVMMGLQAEERRAASLDFPNAICSAALNLNKCEIQKVSVTVTTADQGLLPRGGVGGAVAS